MFYYLEYIMGLVLRNLDSKSNIDMQFVVVISVFHVVGAIEYKNKLFYNLYVVCVVNVVGVVDVVHIVLLHL